MKKKTYPKQCKKNIVVSPVKVQCFLETKTIGANIPCCSLIDWNARKLRVYNVFKRYFIDYRTNLNSSKTYFLYSLF